MDFSYSDSIFFISRLLSLRYSKKHFNQIQKLLKNNSVNLDLIVKTSSEHMLLPALYFNLKKQNLLKYIPAELENYLKNIFTINRNRNCEILRQVDSLNELFTNFKIKPVYIKGVSNIYSGLYDDIGERMIGDIDFIVSESEFEKSISLLKENGYNEIEETAEPLPNLRHYKRLVNPNFISAVEVHKDLIIEKYRNEFCYRVINKNLINLKGRFVMSYENQLVMTIIADFINDRGSYFKNIQLRNAYDVFLILRNVQDLGHFKSFLKLAGKLEDYMAAHHVLFESPLSDSLIGSKTKSNFKNHYLSLIKNDKKRSFEYRIRFFLQKQLWRMSIIHKSLYSPDYMRWLQRRILRILRK